MTLAEYPRENQEHLSQLLGSKSAERYRNLLEITCRKRKSHFEHHGRVSFHLTPTIIALGQGRQMVRREWIKAHRQCRATCGQNYGRGKNQRISGSLMLSGEDKRVYSVLSISKQETHIRSFMKKIWQKIWHRGGFQIDYEGDYHGHQYKIILKFLLEKLEY